MPPKAVSKHITGTEQEKDQEIRITTCDIYVAPSKIANAGYGVFANKSFKKGDVIERAPFLEIETPYGNELMNYVFQSHLDRTKSLIVFGYGSIYNHSLTPNVVYSINPQLPSDRLFTYQAAKPIKKDEELFINYGEEHKVNEMIRQLAQQNHKNTRKPTARRRTLHKGGKKTKTAKTKTAKTKTAKTKTAKTKTKKSAKKL